MSKIYENLVKVFQGDDIALRINVTDSNNNPFNIAGSTVYFTMKNKNDIASNDDSALLTANVTQHVDNANGITAVLISNTLTRTIPLGEYKYDIQIKTSVQDGERIHTLIQGDIVFIDDTTKRS